MISIRRPRRNDADPVGMALNAGLERNRFRLKRLAL
jgi:hypothetical protein